MNRMGKKWFRSIENTDELLAALKISIQKSAFGIQGNILYLPKMNYIGVFMGYLTLCHQYFTFMPNPPLPHHADSIPWPLRVLSVGKGIKSPRLAVP